MEDGPDESCPQCKRLESDDLCSSTPSNVGSSSKRHQSGNSSEVEIFLEEPCINMDENPRYI